MLVLRAVRRRISARRFVLRPVFVQLCAVRRNEAGFAVFRRSRPVAAARFVRFVRFVHFVRLSAFRPAGSAIAGFDFAIAGSDFACFDHFGRFGRFVVDYSARPVAAACFAVDFVVDSAVGFVAVDFVAVVVPNTFY